MSKNNKEIAQESIAFTIKYGFLDYLSAINYKMKNAISVLKSKKELFLAFILYIIKPFVILGISLFAYMTKLKHQYHFNITQDLFIRSHNDIKNEVKWSRFSSFEQNNKFIFLQLDKNKGESDGQVLILKRVLKQAEIEILMGFLKINNIHESGIDNEIETLMKNN